MPGGTAQERDPIPQFKDYCLKNGLLTEQQIKDIEKSVNDEIEEAVQFADESPKPVQDPLRSAQCASPALEKCWEMCIPRPARLINVHFALPFFGL